MQVRTLRKLRDQRRMIETGRVSLGINDFLRISKALGYRPGDLLENSAGLYADMQPILEQLQRLPAPARARTLRVVEEIVGVREDAIIELAPSSHMRIADSNVLAFPPLRTPPRWTEEFPVDPENFNAKGDTDYPIDLHGWETDDLDAAAGDGVGIQNPENSMGTILNSKEVREGRVRSVRVNGNSMAPTFEHGWLIAVDVTRRKPKNEDPVLVYRQETDGMMLGRWEKRGRKIRLIKDNSEFEPVELLDGDKIVGTIIDIIKKPVPPPPAKRKR